MPLSAVLEKRLWIIDSIHFDFNVTLRHTHVIFTIFGVLGAFV